MPASAGFFSPIKESAIKTIPIALAASRSGTSSDAHLLRIARTDGEIFGFTSASEDISIAGTLYRCSPGLSVTNVVTSAGLAVDNLELSTFNDQAVFLTGEVLSGLWRNAEFSICKYNWRSPADGVEYLLAGTIGGVQIAQDKVVAELRGWQQYLQQPVINVTSKTCRARLGDAKCRKDLTAFTFNSAVTGVTSAQVFTASGLGQSSDYFGAGEIQWLTGDNSGLRLLVKTFAAGVVTLALPMFVAIQNGDTFRIIAGCRKRLAEDCFTKFDNVLNFQGEPHLPGIDALTKPPA